MDEAEMASTGTKGRKEVEKQILLKFDELQRREHCGEQQYTFELRDTRWRDTGASKRALAPLDTAGCLRNKVLFLGKFRKRMASDE
jgi:hypothetical protein